MVHRLTLVSSKNDVCGDPWTERARDQLLITLRVKPCTWYEILTVFRQIAREMSIHYLHGKDVIVDPLPEMMRRVTEAFQSLVRTGSIYIEVEMTKIHGSIIPMLIVRAKRPVK